mmetsp:Transcript_9621/g.17396  ORF Transcript_9621/g.17396 Transcript_9621/m.17396 type:complete len:83 (+) Transcript_9621:201-449(+)
MRSLKTILSVFQGSNTDPRGWTGSRNRLAERPPAIQLEGSPSTRACEGLQPARDSKGGEHKAPTAMNSVNERMVGRHLRLDR